MTFEAPDAIESGMGTAEAAPEAANRDPMAIEAVRTIVANRFKDLLLHLFRSVLITKRIIRP